MVIAFPPVACNQHPFPPPRPDPALSCALLAVGALLAGCPAGPTVATLEARPTGTYGEVLSWTAQAPTSGGPRHTVTVEIEIDEAQLMWAKTTFAYSAFVDVGVTGAGNVEEQWMQFPITEERRLGEDDGVITIAYLAAGTPLPSGFRRSETKRALSFKPQGGPVTLTAHLRTPDGADRKALKAIRTVRLQLHSGSRRALTDWVEQPRSVRK
jgi:hypothetical protein